MRTVYWLWLWHYCSGQHWTLKAGSVPSTQMSAANLLSPWQMQHPSGISRTASGLWTQQSSHCGIMHLFCSQISWSWQKLVYVNCVYILACRVTLVEIKDLPLVMRARSDVLVTATLYHGANKLSPSINTGKKSLLLNTIQWNEAIDFEIQKVNIPKVSVVDSCAPQFWINEAQMGLTFNLKCIWFCA